MNRLQFLAELKKSLVETTKEIAFPVISEELEKLDEIVDEVAGVKWVTIVELDESLFNGIQERFIEKHLILFYSDGGKLKAFEKKCLDCNCLVQWISYEKKLECFNCEQTLDVTDDIGDLHCYRFPVREVKGEWQIRF